MNLSLERALPLVREIHSSALKVKKTKVWIAPPFTLLKSIGAELTQSPVRLGAQNVYFEKEGAFTGEVSVPMLQECGVNFAIIGHSERRHILQESNELCVKRAIALRQSSGFSIIFCVGETLAEREAGITAQILKRQLASLFSEISKEEADRIVIAYEPVWAIGTGKVASLKDIQEAHACITDACHSAWQKEIQILYGGSVTPENFKEILQVPLVAGGLIGGASLSSEKFQKLIQISESV